MLRCLTSAGRNGMHGDEANRKSSSKHGGEATTCAQRRGPLCARAWIRDERPNKVGSLTFPQWARSRAANRSLQRSGAVDERPAGLLTAAMTIDHPASIFFYKVRRASRLRTGGGPCHDCSVCFSPQHSSQVVAAQQPTSRTSRRQPHRKRSKHGARGTCAVVMTRLARRNARRPQWGSSASPRVDERSSNAPGRAGRRIEPMSLGTDEVK